MKGDQVPDTDHITRYCPGGSIEDGKISGIAFRRRKDELYLSVNWIEFLKKENRLAEVAEIRTILSSKLKISSNAKIAVLIVGQVRNHVLSNSEDRRSLNVIHEPEITDPSHSGIHNLNLEDDLIADLIAQTIQEIYPAKSY